MADVIIALLTIPVFFFTASGTGMLALGLIKRGGAEKDRALFGFAAGAVIIPLVFLISGKLGMFAFPHVSGLALLFISVSALRFKQVFLSLKESLRGINAAGLGAAGIIVALLFLPRLLNVFFNVFAPPISWDTLAYHFAIPKIYMQEQAVTYIPYMFHSNWPQNMEILFGAGLVISGPLTAQAIAFCYALALLYAVYMLASETAGLRAGITAAALVAAFSVFKREAVNGYVDCGVAMFTVTALYAVIRLKNTGSAFYLFASALSAAGAASVKILGLFSPLITAIMILVLPYLGREEKPGLTIKDAAIFSAVTFVFFFAWYLKSWADTGNPVWPFAYNIFGGLNWTKELSDYRSLYYDTQGSGKGILQLLALPYTLITSKNMDGYAGNHIILYLACLPGFIALLLKDKKPALIIISVFVVSFMLLWFLATQMIRFLVPGLCVMAAAAAVVFDTALKSGKKLHAILLAPFFLFVLLYSFPFRHDADFFGLRNLAGKMDVNEHLKIHQDNYALYKRVNGDDSINGKICLIRETRGYYLDRPYVWGDPANQGLIDYKDAESTVKAMESLSISHIIYNENVYKNAEKDGYTPAVMSVINEVLKEHAELLYCENNACLYALKTR